MSPLAETTTASETVDGGHGRVEQRRLSTSTALVGYRDGPGLAQVSQVERRVTLKKNGTQRHKVVCGVTSPDPKRAGSERVLGLMGQHWQIENRVHWVRDVTFD